MPIGDMTMIMNRDVFDLVHDGYMRTFKIFEAILKLIASLVLQSITSGTSAAFLVVTGERLRMEIVFVSK